jgi:hypothetical protein
MIDTIIELGHESGILCLFYVQPWNACPLLFYLSSVYQYRNLVQSIIFTSRTMDVFVQRLSEMIKACSSCGQLNDASQLRSGSIRKRRMFMQGIKYSNRSTCTYMRVKCDSTPNKNENGQNVRMTLCKHRGKQVGNVRKIIVVQRKGRTCGDGMETKWWVITMQIGVAISLITRMFMLLTRARTSVRMSISRRKRHRQ